MTLRVPMVSTERARELGEATGMPARRTHREAFRVVANNPGVARVAFSQLMQLLENNKFDTRLREWMIMRIAWVTGSAYEWTQHWRVATTAGIHDSAWLHKPKREVCCLLRDPAMPTIGKNPPDPANAPNQPARGNFKRLTEQRMDGVDDPDFR